MKERTDSDIEKEILRKGIIIKRLIDLKAAMMVAINYDEVYINDIEKIIDDLKDDYYFEAHNLYFRHKEIDDPIADSLNKI